MIIYLIIGENKSGSAAINRCNLFIKGINEKNSDKAKLKIFKNRNYSLKGFSILYKLLILVCVHFYILFNRSSTFIFYGEFSNLYFIKLLKSRKSKWISERNEFPSHIISSSISTLSYKRSVRYDLFMSNFDALITCSEALRIYYSKFISPNSPIFILPAIVNTDLFYTKGEYNKTKVRYITYCGDWGNNKDGVPDLIRAFNVFSKNHIDFKLQLIGSTSNLKDYNEIKSLILKFNLGSKVELVGRVSHSSVPNFYQYADILVLCRPSNKQAEGGFPSKVVEYLASGKPVLVTDVGELSNYFVDNLNIFYSKANYHHFSQRLSEIVQDWDNSLSVGNKGREVSQIFSYQRVSDKFLQLIKTL
ncbi:glycosyltransferase family 4 protein [Algoriphagus sp. C2-6-M1]|uniref:glycosyltransferase family 4 protein n=1 Tax=Algoriphagus persicinus TaxID=3108754 RepID=UPI002B3729BC|nr:glycosyltransferase family 4 protein [Algoriphagus sp. C2-6-M1]MEB2781269.1 glycosyltransferase family 4 protein [Algoriphagus sp. C2-6-M1]